VLNLNDIKRIAHLARIELSDAETAPMLTELHSIFQLIEQMRAVDTTGIAPLAHPIEGIQTIRLRLREDNVTETVIRDSYQHLAPAVQDGLYLAPQVIE
jgi:aspartyl-tRNA(Asn)/glutamyl-tRNA(Gln) amidotransferase subunit C